MKTYRIPDGDGGMSELDWVTPIKDPKLRLVAISEHDAEVLAEYGIRHQQLGTPHADVLVGLAAAYKVALDA